MLTSHEDEELELPFNGLTSSPHGVGDVPRCPLSRVARLGQPTSPFRLALVPHPSITPCIDACSMHLRCAPPEIPAPFGALASPSPNHRSSLTPLPIVPAVVEATRDIVSMSSALPPQYLFVSKHLSRLAVVVFAALPPYYISSFSLHTCIDLTTMARCVRALFIPVFWTHVVIAPRASSRPIPHLTHIKRLCFAARVVLMTRQHGGTTTFARLI